MALLAILANILAVLATNEFFRMLLGPDYIGLTPFEITTLGVLAYIAPRLP